MDEFQTQTFWKNMEKKMTYRELRDVLNSLSESQLNMPVRWGGENNSGFFTKVWIVEEDQINPSGDGWEPVSAYKDDPDFPDIHVTEPVVCKKDTPILLTD